MVRNIARSLGRTASAAAKAVGGRAKTTPATTSAPVKKTAAKRDPAKKTVAKKSPATKAPASTPAKKTAAKKAPAKKAPAEKAPAVEKSPAEKSPPTKTPAAKKSPVKKSPAKKASAARLPVRSGESAWTAKELAEVVAELRSQREHSLALMSAQSDELTGLMGDAGDGAGHDQADVGSTTFERDHEMTILHSERDKLEQIDRALTRIEDGSYGACESCGEPIGKMRLMAFPRATLCMSCKQREERR